MAVPSPPASLTSIAQSIEARLDTLLEAEESRWSALDSELRGPLVAIRQLVVAGGKRLRPAFCYWGFVGLGGSPDDPAWVDAGAAFELLHAFALFHDDVMDGSSTRRGERTIHLSYADRHDEGGWAGEARRFGEGVAILVGDLAFVYADQLLHDAPPAARRLWTELRIELNIGQYLDIVGTARGERSRVIAERIARFKSAKYTIERPLHLGALLADPGSAAMLPALSAYGLPLGDAFQMRDDVLGAFGDQDVTGKPVGDDLREGKPTPLLAIAHERATAAELSVLRLVGRPDLSTNDVGRIQAVLVETGALAALEAQIDELTTTAIGSLASSGLTTRAQVALEELARYVAWRSA